MHVISRTPVSNPHPPDLSLLYTPALAPGGGTILQVANPDPRTGKVLGPYAEGGSQAPLYTGDRLSLSCQPDGHLEVRPEDTAEASELVTIAADGRVTFWPGQAQRGSPLYWSTCYTFEGALDVPELAAAARGARVMPVIAGSSLVAFVEAIAQDQLVASSNPGKVCVNYPRGTQSRLVFDATVDPPVLRVDGMSPPLDNAFSQFFVTSSGHLGHLLDRKNVIAALVPGLDLKAPTP